MLLRKSCATLPQCTPCTCHAQAKQMREALAGTVEGQERTLRDLQVDGGGRQGGGEQWIGARVGSSRGTTSGGDGGGSGCNRATLLATVHRAGPAEGAGGVRAAHWLCTML